MKPTTDELIKKYKEHDCKINKEGHCLEGTILYAKLQGRLDVLEENHLTYRYDEFCTKCKEIAKIKEVLK